MSPKNSRHTLTAKYYPSDNKWRSFRLNTATVGHLAKKPTFKVDWTCASCPRPSRWRSAGGSPRTSRNTARHAWTVAWIRVAAELVWAIPGIIAARGVARHRTTWTAPADCSTVRQPCMVCGLQQFFCHSQEPTRSLQNLWYG